MSVIAAKVYEDRIVIAADSILIKGESKRNANFSKLIECNGMIIGGSGSAEELSLMRHYVQDHSLTSATEKAVLEFFIEFAKWKNEMNLEMEVENEYLLAYDGHLFEIESLFVHEVLDYVAIGAGEDFATAALYLNHTPKEAVKVACDLSCFVCEPINECLMWLERKDK